ncbi:hypothetical protein V7S43_015283 [Phytophthora oleae]|uniref:Uncharacterized protein n=1 Tax=Phytophthora oleae TaxID=2107226 RepID=A0ABD3F1V7_9STRA
MFWALDPPARRNMMKLLCAIVGVAETTFEVSIDNGGPLADSEAPVHVLVVVPETAGDPKSESSATDRMIKEIYETTVLKKCKIYYHSQMNSTNDQELLQALGIRMNEVRFPVGTNSEVARARGQ